MSISLNIKAAKKLVDSKVNIEGIEKYVITSTERNSFGFGTDSLLKNAIGILRGKKPDYAYLTKKETELYKKYNWNEVAVILKPKSAEILEVSSKPTIIKTQSFKNDSSVTTVCSSSISSQVTHTLTNTWNSSQSVAFSEKIKAKLTLLGVGGEEETSFGYTYTWGKGGTISKSETKGSTSSVSVTLNPGESVQAILSSSKGTMKIKVVYTATLMGDTAYDYSDTYEGHHFYSSSINDIIDKAGTPQGIDITEEIVIDYYTDSKIHIIDNNGNLRQTFLVNDQLMCLHLFQNQ